MAYQRRHWSNRSCSDRLRPRASVRAYADDHSKTRQQPSLSDLTKSKDQAVFPSPLHSPSQIANQTLLFTSRPPFARFASVSLEQLESAILELSPEERQRLVLWFEEHRRDLLGDEGDELSDKQQAEILRRRDQATAHPELLEPWNGIIERVRERLHEFRRQESSAR